MTPLHSLAQVVSARISPLVSKTNINLSVVIKSVRLIALALFALKAVVLIYNLARFSVFHVVHLVKNSYKEASRRVSLDSSSALKAPAIAAASEDQVRDQPERLPGSSASSGSHQDSPVYSLAPVDSSDVFSQASSSSSSEVIPAAQKLLQIDWDQFSSYHKDHCTGDLQEHQLQAYFGLNLLQKIYRDEWNPASSTEVKEKELQAVCWGLMLYAICKGEDFAEGTFDLPDPNSLLFDYFRPIFYQRYSSHYKKRVIAKPDEIGHFGCDFSSKDHLPSQKRTVLVGQIEARGEDRIYIKCENYGADLAVTPENIPHLVGHTKEFVVSQARRIFPSIFGDVGSGPAMRKEHIPPKVKEKCQELVKSIEHQEFFVKGYDFSEYGISDYVNLFNEALLSEKINEETKQEIRKYLDNLSNQYDNLKYRKGNEVQIISESILQIELIPPPDINMEETDGFVQVNFQ